VPVFEKLRSRRADRYVFLSAFDLLDINGLDLRREPLEIRKRQLSTLLRKVRFGLQLNDQDEPGDVVFRHACKLGFEGSGSAPAIAWGARAIGQDEEPGRAGGGSLKLKNPSAAAVTVRLRRTGGGDKGARNPCGRLELWSQCAFSVRRGIYTDSTSPPMAASPLFLLLMHREPTLRQPQHIWSRLF
jgi:hypothetical protein